MFVNPHGRPPPARQRVLRVRESVLTVSPIGASQLRTGATVYYSDLTCRNENPSRFERYCPFCFIAIRLTRLTVNYAHLKRCS
jgi:hypothetical protein